MDISDEAHLRLKVKLTDEALNDSLNEVSVFHPEHAFTAAVSHELVTQVLRPVGPLVWPRAVPGEAAPGVPQTQQSEHKTRSARSCFTDTGFWHDECTTTHFSENPYGLLFCSLHNSMIYLYYMQSGRSVTVHIHDSLVLTPWFGTFSGTVTKHCFFLTFSLNSAQNLAQSLNKFNSYNNQISTAKSVNHIRACRLLEY